MPADAGSEAMTSLSGGQAARVNLAAAAVPLRRLPARRADQRPGHRRAGDPRRLRAGPAGRNRPGQPRPCVSRAHRAPGPGTRPGAAAGTPLRRRLCRLPGGAQIVREYAREAYEKYADTRAGLQQRMRTQIGWADKGVREARPKATVNDKHTLHRQVTRSEKPAGKVKATERMLDRLDVVAEPRKEWQLKMEIAAAPRSGTVAATLRDAVIERGGFRLGPVSLQSTGPTGSPSPARTGPATRPSAERYSAATAGIGSRVPGQRYPGRRGGPSPQPVRRRGPAAGGVHGAGPEPAPRGHQDATGQVRAGGRPWRRVRVRRSCR